ncbi:MAG: SEC-C metal-binding domain-containing protein [Selenomonadaceae bacterium]|nr:SEC-C metal-binding domain-containing protein [Selenomonadaceae bacterium]
MSKEKKNQPAETVENNDVLAEMSRELQEAAAARKAKLLKRAVPEERTLANALNTLTKADLEDVAFNVGVNVKSSWKKADLVAAIAPAIQSFAGRWLVTIVDEQYNAFKHIVEKDGITTEFREDEMRLDYFQGIGVVFGGSVDGKIAWYMPDEIIEEFKKLDSESFKKAIEFNTDVLRIATGILFYYGVLDHDELYATVKKYLAAEIENEAGFEFSAFMGIMLTGCCWQYHIKMDQHYAAYYTVVNPQQIHEIAHSRELSYAKLSYGQVYDAGDENYIEATDAYKALAQFLMQEYKLDVMNAAGVVGQLAVLWQNAETVKAGLDYLASLGQLPNEKNSELEALVMGYHHSIRFWIFKGHTTGELISGKLDPEEDNVVSLAAHRKNKNKVGRNDPCPCGSGKKYKNCCLRK